MVISVPDLCRLLYHDLGWFRFGGGSRLLFAVELVTAFRTFFRPGSLDPCFALGALLLSQS